MLTASLAVPPAPLKLWYRTMSSTNVLLLLLLLKYCSIVCGNIVCLT